MGVYYRVLVDWDNSGTFVVADEQPVLNADGVDIRAGRDQPRQFAPTRPGDAAWTADGSDLRFTDPAGSIGANLLPYRPARVEAVDDGTGVATPLFTGYVDEWTVRLDNYPLIAAAFSAADGLARLADSTVSTPLYNGLRTDQAIGYVLDAAGWPADRRQLDAGLSVLGYWWLDETNALQALQTLADHEQGFFYVDPAGVLVFENRYNRDDRLNTLAATWADDGAVKRLNYKTGLKDVVNRVSVTVKPRAQAGSLSAVWQLGSTLTLGPNDSRRLYARASDPFTGLAFTAGTDYTVTAGSLTTATATQAGGALAYVDLTAGASGATITGLQIRGYAVAVTSTVTWTFDDATSQAAYGLRPVTFNLDYLQDINVARDAAQGILGRYKDPVQSAEVTLRTRPGAASQDLTDLLNVGLSDRVHVVLPAIGADWYGWVESIHHTPRGDVHEAIFTVQAQRQEPFATLDSDDYGLLDDPRTVLGW